MFKLKALLRLIPYLLWSLGRQINVAKQKLSMEFSHCFLLVSERTSVELMIPVTKDVALSREYFCFFPFGFLLQLPEQCSW